MGVRIEERGKRESVKGHYLEKFSGKKGTCKKRKEGKILI